jgi:hypothetical protein
MAIWVGLGVYWALGALAVPTEEVDWHALISRIVAAVAFGFAASQLETLLKEKK